MMRGAVGASPKKAVALFGLSANPPTGSGGHVGIVQWLATRRRVPELGGRDIDEVWVLPVYRHAFNTKRDLAGFEHRVAMARLAFEHLPGLEGRVKVLEIERELTLETQPSRADPDFRVFTIDVLRRLTAEHPETDFLLVLGADTYRDLKSGKWRESQQVLQLVPVLVIPRKGEHPPQSASDAHPNLTDISSTKVRSSTDLDFLREVLPRAVLNYIVEHRLYAFADKES